jgi:hypothetical protein
MQALNASIDRYDAIVTSVRMSDYGYWVVTYSVAPGVAMSVMVCQTGISPVQALTAGQATLTAQTGQKVRP